MPAKRAKGARKAKRSKANHGTREVSKFAVTSATPDGTAFPLGCPTLRAIPPSGIYRFEFLVPQIRRYSIHVGTSAIADYVNFTAAQITAATAFLATFDQYRISKVTCLLTPIGIQSYTGFSSGDIPRLSTAIDFNDGSTNQKLAADYSNGLTVPMTTPIVRSFTPRVAFPVYSGGATFSYTSVESSVWIDSNYQSVPHYQLVVNCSASSIDAQFVTSLDVVYSLEFRNRT